MGVWCGYVAVEGDMPYGSDDGDYADELQNAAYRGITYANQADSNVTVYGFDCGHWCDLSPVLAGLGADQGGEYRTHQFAKEYVTEMAHAVKRLKRTLS
jgi:hypothetical protein